MNNKILSIVAILMVVFPFVTVAYELALKESMMTVAVFIAIAVILAVTVIAAFMSSKTRSS